MVNAHSFKRRKLSPRLEHQRADVISISSDSSDDCSSDDEPRSHAPLPAHDFSSGSLSDSLSDSSSDDGPKSQASLPAPIPASTSAPTSQPMPTPSSQPLPAPRGLKAEDEPILCKEQQELVDLILSGRNVFYTGSAGCGKSTVLKTAVRKLQDRGMSVHVIAPTGAAALQVNGVTTWGYMSWTPDDAKRDLDAVKKLGFRNKVSKRLRGTDVLIIDEISMVESNQLDRINTCMKHVRCYDSSTGTARIDAPAFGGVQVIITGDFCQLPPVKPFQYCLYCGQETIQDGDNDEYNCPDNHGPWQEKDKWAFRSEAWQEAKLVHVHLRQIHRQSDQAFIKLLQKCRLGISLSRAERDMLLGGNSKPLKYATKLLPMRKDVDRENRVEFNKLKSPVHLYHALDGFELFKKADGTYDQEMATKYSRRGIADGTLDACRDHRLDAEVSLRVGMHVVLQVNLDITAGLVNGSQGIICGFEPFDPASFPLLERQAKDVREKNPNALANALVGENARLRVKQIKHFMDRQAGMRAKEEMVQAQQAQQGWPERNRSLSGTVWPRVHFHHNQVQRTIYGTCLINAVGSKEPFSLLHRTQVPLIPGWAVSIHRSQGMTLNRVFVNLSNAFAEGQVYVALSRATSLEGLRVQSAVGLDVGKGGNKEVHEFLRARFGDEIFPARRDSVPSSSLSKSWDTDYSDASQG